MGVATGSTVTVRAPCAADVEQWSALYTIYAAHYETELSAEHLHTTWSWLMDAQHPVQGLVAHVGREMVGLMHYRAVPSPLRAKDSGFLDDLVVLPAYRGTGVAQQLFTALKTQAQHHGWDSVRWITQENNYRARALYDKHAQRTTWVLYEQQP